MTDRLAELLRGTEPLRDPVPFEAVERAVRSRRRRRRRDVVLIAVVAATAASVVPVLARTRAAPAPLQVVAPSSVPADRVASYGGISVAVPAGWQVAAPRLCQDFVDHEVVIGPEPTAQAFCPYPRTQNGVVGVIVTFEDQRNAATVAAAPDVRWGGQPVVTTVRPRRPGAAPATDGEVASVELPLFGAYVEAAAPTATEALALLDRVAVDAASTLDVPATAASLQVSTVSLAEKRKERDVTTTSPARVQAVLDALRAAPLLSPSTPLCDVDASRPVALLTLPARRTIQVRLGGCDEVVVGNGTLAEATPELKAALATVVGAAALE